MICPQDDTQMYQKGRTGDGEIHDTAQATWMLLACPVCGYQAVEFKAVFVVTDPEDARVRSGILLARAMEKVVPRT
jgi:hypothetical protein